MKKYRIGIIGCGMVSDFYISFIQQFGNIELAACSDMFMKRAEEKSQRYHIEAMDYAQIMSRDDIDIILNLTPPLMHARVALDALQAHKHTFSEKPLGVTMEEAREICALAAQQGLFAGCAPDTFLGAGQQTARKLIDDHWIGRVLSGTAIVQGRGPEKWGHAPAFFAQGAGPMLDLGPYYITTLVNMLGPARKVTAVTARGEDFRTFGSEVAEQYKDTYRPYGPYPVTVNTHQTGIIEFASGALITMIASFDVFQHGHNPIELYGTEGSLILPDPNTFGGDIKLFRPDYEDFLNVPLAFDYAENCRGLGLVDMINAMDNGIQPRSSCDMGLHVLEIMLAFDESSRRQAPVTLTTSCKRPEAMPLTSAFSSLR